MQNDATEYKDKVGGDTLGVSAAGKTSRLGSPVNGVPILEGEGNRRQMIRQMEKLLGIRSWIDNV